MGPFRRAGEGVDDWRGGEEDSEASFGFVEAVMFDDLVDEMVGEGDGV